MTTKMQSDDVEHYLLTAVPLHTRLHVHCYLMTNDQAGINGALNRMADKLEEIDLAKVPTVILQTKLDSDGVVIVRDFISGEHESVKRRLATATDFHLTMWISSEDHPGDIRLMELH